MKSNKVLHIINDLDSGGAERMLYNILRNTANPELHAVISLHDKGIYGEQIEKLGIPLYTLNISKRNLLRSFNQIRQLAKEYDVLDTWLYQSDFVGALINKSFKRKKKLIWNVRHANLDPLYNKKSTLKIVAINAKLSKNVSTITYNSNKALNEHESVGYSSHSSQVMPNGFDLEKFSYSEIRRSEVRSNYELMDEKVLITVGRWNIQKDYKTLIEALALVVLKNNNFKMFLVGKDLDSNNQELVEMIENNNLSNNILLVGMQRDIGSFLSASDIYISSSLGESFSNSIGEAMCSGLQIIATDVGDSKLIVRDAGIIVPAQEPNLLSKAILLKLMENNKTRNDQAYQIIKENYDINVVTEKFEKLY